VNEATPQPKPSHAPPADPGGAEPASRAGQSTRAAGGPRAGEISIPALITTFRGGIWLFAAVVAVCVLVTAIELKLRLPQYTATMTVAPADADFTAASQLAGELEQFAGLATLGQSAAKIERVSDLERYAQLFGSTALAERLQAEHPLLREVFADEWDPERQAFRPPPGLGPRLERAVLGFFGYPTWTEPDVVRLAGWLGEHVDVSRLGNSSLFQIEITDRRRAFAVSLIDMAHHTADEMLRQSALDRVGGQIAQLESELAKAADPTRKQALEAMLTEQYQAQARLQADQPYAAQVVVPAMASTTPSSLNPLLVLAMAVVVGAILGLFVVFLRDALRSPQP
jgi:hypothetical protein